MQQQEPRPERRPQNSTRSFKEKYLPLIIGGAALLMILVLVIGAVSRSIEHNKRRKQALEAASQSQSEEKTRLNQEAYQLMSQAAALAENYDYDGAIALLDSFEGDLEDFPQITAKRDEYVLSKSQLVAWEDPNQILNLSLQMLIADPQRAFSDETFSASFRRNFLTIAEFSAILEELYSNDYVLISLDDFIVRSETNYGTVYTTKPLYLPEGKKPLLLTQTNVNYHTYLIDGDDEDLYADKDGSGFASKLILDESGKITCEYVDASGQTLTGPYDMVPILDEFVEQHPDFSYRGAKAVLALTGYDGLFGYRTNNEAKGAFGVEIYEKEVEMAGKVAQALRDDGYTLACYTYQNENYKVFSYTQVRNDINNWENQVEPILGDIDVFVFAQNADIEDESEPYSGDKYNLLHSLGFGIFLGFSHNGNKWTYVSPDYIRQGRIVLSPNTIKHYGVWFEGIINTKNILDPSRGEIPM